MIKERKVKISLLPENGGKALDEIIFSEEHNISEKLLPSIDKILKRHKLSAKKIKKIDLETDLGESFTTYRIAKATVDAFNWATRNA
jgi:hypothetical protein